MSKVFVSLPSAVVGDLMTTAAAVGDPQLSTITPYHFVLLARFTVRAGPTTEVSRTFRKTDANRFRNVAMDCC